MNMIRPLCRIYLGYWPAKFAHMSWQYGIRGQADVYKKSYGMIYLCRPCQAWLGVDEGTDLALGRLANAHLRQLKMLAHRWFDPIAVEGLINDFYPVQVTGMNTRKGLLLAGIRMGIKKELCHIGMFDEEECKQVIAICQPIVESFEGTGDR